jgi:hypothetical protein
MPKNIRRPGESLSRSSIRRPRSRGWRPFVEVLEPRRLLAAISWVSTTSGSWDVASNWSTDAVPGAGDDVVIDVPE